MNAVGCLTALEKTSRNLILECYHNQIHWRCGRYCSLVFPLLNLPSYIVWFKNGDPTLITKRDGASKNKKGETLSNKMSVMIVISSPPPSPHQVFWHVKWVVSNFYLTVNTVAFWPTPMLNWYQYQFRELTSSNSSLLWWFAYVTIKSDTSCTFQGGRVSSAIEIF